MLIGTIASFQGTLHPPAEIELVSRVPSPRASFAFHRKMTTTAPIVTLQYQDLVDFDANDPNLQLIDDVGRAFGSDDSCLGILAVESIPGWQDFRETLLPLAAKLPHLDDLQGCVLPEALYSTGWSHGKEELSPGRQTRTPLSEQRDDQELTQLAQQENQILPKEAFMETPVRIIWPRR